MNGNDQPRTSAYLHLSAISHTGLPLTLAGHRGEGSGRVEQSLSENGVSGRALSASGFAQKEKSEALS